jgi:hypothetical protein
VNIVKERESEMNDNQGRLIQYILDNVTCLCMEDSPCERCTFLADIKEKIDDE